MAILLQDVRQSIRQLVREPMFTATAVLTLAVGMGVNAVAFGIVNGLLFKSYALSGIPGVGRLATMPGGDESGYASLAEYRRFGDATAGALDLAAEGRSSIAWRHDGSAETAWVLYVSRNYFSLVDAPVIVGRRQVDRDGAAVSAIIGERFWRETLGAPAISGLTLRLNHVDVSVAGVVDGSFTGPAGIYSPDIWLPLEQLPLFGAAPLMEQRDTRWLFLMGRLLDGASAPQVHAHVQAAAAEMASDWPDTHRDRSAEFRMLDGGTELRGIATAAAILMGIIGLVLLLACFNVANLLLARAVERERDMGIRTALGARPSRLMRLVVTEGCIIATLSGAIALLLAWWTQSLVGSFAIPIEQPQHIDLTPDWRVGAFIGALIVIAGVLPGVWPAMAAARVDGLTVLRSQSSGAGPRPSRLRRWLVGVQIAGSTAFLAITALFLQSQASLGSLDTGFARDEILVADFDPAPHGFDAAAAERFVQAFADRVRALPGVRDAAVIDHAPFFVGFNQTTVVWPPGRSCGDGDCRRHATYAISPGYLRTMGIGLAAGREFDAGARGDVILNGLLAQTLWPDGDAVGQSLRIGEKGETVTVIGVTAPMRTRGLDRETPLMFVPIDASHYARGVSLVVRTAAPPPGLIQSVRQAAASIDPNVALAAVKTMEQRMAVQIWPFRTLTRLFAICGLVALILATAGLAGVVVHAVNRRVREFGVRMSIGATRRDLMTEVLGSGARLLAPGLGTGLLLAAGAAQLMRSMFLGVNVLNPLTYLAVAVAQSAIVLLACIGPALRASRVDPLAALRSE